MAGMSVKLLEGDRALITGAAGGIGRGIAKALMAEGARVLGSDIVPPPAEDGIEFLAGDLSRREGWRTLLNSAVQRLGTISLFVHAASPRRREADTALSVSEETWEAMTAKPARRPGRTAYHFICYSVKRSVAMRMSGQMSVNEHPGIRLCETIE